MRILDNTFYQRSDVLQISRELLGKYLFTEIDGDITGGKVVETEAYAHQGDRATEMHLNRRNTRTDVMFQPGGVAYVYTVYRIHRMFNIIANKEGKPDAVLIRAIEPSTGIEIMKQRREINDEKRLTAGPGMLTQALGISTDHYGIPVTTGKIIWLEDRGEAVNDDNIIASPRVGIDYAGEDAQLPWRFRIKDNPWVSKAK
ncbi:DNA-3-methyladenine glycosylase [Tunicatimonas pelagia]|uniref:DNA-3-methyladenine glycosylase n=1 Tax=Tunicatimonas pelagia TaxID=931531 RepID=UPI0026671E88|nr:DNA-3-methyladenine glycosylase [Tunicatimonas pelagia]WKN41449.1 DNA-3-methyladenine glycosylase [Tunicatimonas pelagia]